MQIGVLSDIHGNDIALEAVLSDAASMGVDHLLILGDIVGYYYNPDKVLTQLQDWSYDMIAGNHEQMMKQSMTDNEYLEKVTRQYGSGIKVALQKLTAEQIDYLGDLSEYKNVILDNVNIGLYHGSPRDNDEYIYPDANHDLLRQISRVQNEYILMGHTHYPMCAHIDNHTLLNPGSVGQPRDIGGLASWAIINTSNKMVVHRRVKFKVDELINECKKNDPDIVYLRDVLVRDVTR
jgi:putative phosphoesterase